MVIGALALRPLAQDTAGAGSTKAPKTVSHWRDPAFVEQGPRAGHLPTAGHPIWEMLPCPSLAREVGPDDAPLGVP